MQRAIVAAIRKHRSPDSHFAGDALINRKGPRVSDDLDIFHDRDGLAKEASRIDLHALRGAGFRIAEVLKDYDNHVTAVIEGWDGRVRIDWAQESAYRFFPLADDEELGWMLHPFDVATNKVLAMANRHAARDLVDMVTLHQDYLSLGALCWAAVGKDPGFAPEGLLDDLTRHARHTQTDIDLLATDRSLDIGALSRTFRAAVKSGRELVKQLPPHLLGAAFVDAKGQPIVPDPDDPETLSRPRFGHVGGIVPTIEQCT